MQKRLPIILAAIAVLSAGGLSALNTPGQARAQNAIQEAAAQEQTATFAIQNMTCATCPITVRTAMERVEGVTSVEIDFDAKTAAVIFDPSATSAEEIAAASTNAGYPAKPAG